jgi:Pyruvate/2-oxoacid:ferredoxin oxidoreductase delta subunit
MSKRQVIKIDEGKCTGCGLCIPNCAEGALKIVNGKAKLVKDIYCDGLGACLGHCPEGALSIEKRDADEFNEGAVQIHLEELKTKKAQKLPCGCPGTMVKAIQKQEQKPLTGSVCQESNLANWPIQLMLVPVHAPYLKNAELLIAADCTGFSYPNLHKDYLKGKVLVVGCPKLDAGNIYKEKLTEIIKENDLKSITVLHMEVPCCFGLKQIVYEAVKDSGNSVDVKEVVVGIAGDVK